MVRRRRWHAIQHVPFEGPGLIASEAERRGLPLTVCRTYLGDPLPEPTEIDGLIVMGGPMSVNDVDTYPHLADELALLAACVEADVPVLGVCLGCQLLAQALGGRVYRGEEPEIGPGTVSLTAESRRDPVLSPALLRQDETASHGMRSDVPDDPEMAVIHWHQDTFELPAGATRLARNDLYENQAFRAGERAYGVQFHVEVDRGLAEEWAPRLPAGIEISEATRARVEQGGRCIIEAFFDLTQAGTRAD